MLIYKYEIPDPKRAVKTKMGMGPSGRLIPFKPEPLDTSLLIGREIVGWTPHAGTYGMGGPGFVGFDLSGEWLIIAIWGAADWIRFDGRLLGDIFAAKRGRPMGWDAEPEAARRTLFSGHHFVMFNVERNSLSAALEDGRKLTISQDPSDRPLLEGNGNRREVGPKDDLRRVVFLAPTTEIWV